MELSVERISGGYYQASEENSPSPDYPSEIETVGSNVNLFDKDNQDMFLNGLIPDNAGEIQVGTTNTSASNYLVTIIVPCLPNSTYIISRYAEGRIFFVYESSKKDLEVGDNVTLLKMNDNTGIINEKITTGANAKYLLVKIYNTYMIEPNTYNDLISSVKVEKGTVATPYSPYGMGSVEKDVVNKNLFTSVKSQSVESNGIALSYNAYTQEFHAEGITTSTNFYCNMRCGEMNFLKVNKNYIFSVNNSMVEKCLFQITSANVGNNGDIQAGEKSVKIVNLDKYIPNSVMFYSSNIEIGTKISYTFKVQIEEGTTATDIVEHQSQSVIMPIQQEMLEEDYFDWNNEREVHKFEKIVLNGNEDIRIREGANSKKIFGIAVEKEPIYTSGAEFKNIYCNMATASSRDTLFNTKTLNLISYGSANKYYNDIVFSFVETQNMTVDEFKAWVKNKYDAGTPIIVYYKLAEPINLELTSEQKAVRNQKLYTYKNITNISLSNELASIDVTYKKDLETMFNNIIKQIPSSTSDTAKT